MLFAEWEEDEVALAYHVAYAKQGIVMTWVHFGYRSVSFCHCEDGMTPVGLAGSMFSRRASWKSPGACEGPPGAIGAVILLLLCSTYRSMMLTRGMVGQTLTLPSLLSLHSPFGL